MRELLFSSHDTWRVPKVPKVPRMPKVWDFAEMVSSLKRDKKKGLRGDDDDNCDS